MGIVNIGNLSFARYDTAVSAGDVVNIVGEFDCDGVCRISNQSNLIVVDPDRLLSGTSVVSSVRCMRRFYLFFIFPFINYCYYYKCGRLW